MSRNTPPRWQMRMTNWLLPRRAFKFFVRDWAPLEDLDRVADALASMRQSARLQPAVMSAPRARKIAVVAPHPDDESIGCGGTLLAARGGDATVDVVFLTDGPPAAASVRRREAEAACRIIGARPAFLGYSPRAIPVDRKGLQRCAAAIDAVSPDALFIPFLADDHDDHRRANELLLRAADGAMLRAKPEIWAYQVYTSMPCNVLIDIGAYATGKSEAIRCHASQMAERDWVRVALGLNAYNARFGPDAGPYEGFFVLPFEDYLELLRRYFKDPVHACYRSASYRAGANAT
jgi:LmbE family N-acetylglucosaminyl deacetylase